MHQKQNSINIMNSWELKQKSKNSNNSEEQDLLQSKKLYKTIFKLENKY